MSNKYGAVIKWSDEDQSFVAISPSFPGLTGVAEDASEALSELQEAIELALEEYEESGIEPPSELSDGGYSGQFRLRIAKSLHAALAIRADHEGVSLNSLAAMILTQGLSVAQGRRDAFNDLAPLIQPLSLSALRQEKSHSVNHKVSGSSGTFVLAPGTGH